MSQKYCNLNAVLHLKKKVSSLRAKKREGLSGNVERSCIKTNLETTKSVSLSPPINVHPKAFRIVLHHHTSKQEEKKKTTFHF